MFSVTDTSHASPALKQAAPKTPYHARKQAKTQFGTPNSYCSAVTQSPATAESSKKKKPIFSKSQLHFEASSHRHNSRHSLISGGDHVSQQHEFSTTQFAFTSESKTGMVTPKSARGNTRMENTSKESFNEFGTPKSVFGSSSAVKTKQSITAGVVPRPSRIPTRGRRTSNLPQAITQKCSGVGTSANKRKWNTNCTNNKASEVVRRTSFRPVKMDSGKRMGGYNPTASRRYVGGARPSVHVTAKRGHVIEQQRQGMDTCRRMHGGVRSRPAYEKKLTTPEPFRLASVELHERRMESIRERWKQEQEQEKRRRIIRPVTLRREILLGPTFVPQVGRKKATKVQGLLPNASKRRERTLAYEAQQRERVEEMERMKAMAQRQRLLTEEERKRDEYERSKFRPRAVPKSHYKPHTPPKRTASLALMRRKQEAEMDMLGKGLLQMNICETEVEVCEELREENWMGEEKQACHDEEAHYNESNDGNNDGKEDKLAVFMDNKHMELQLEKKVKVKVERVCNGGGDAALNEDCEMGFVEEKNNNLQKENDRMGEDNKENEGAGMKKAKNESRDGGGNRESGGSRGVSTMRLFAEIRNTLLGRRR